MALGAYLEIGASCTVMAMMCNDATLKSGREMIRHSGTQAVRANETRDEKLVALALAGPELRIGGSRDDRGDGVCRPLRR